MGLAVVAVAAHICTLLASKMIPQRPTLRSGVQAETKHQNVGTTKKVDSVTHKVPTPKMSCRDSDRTLKLMSVFKTNP